MTVLELKNALENFPDDMIVTSEHYESGAVHCQDINSISIETIKFEEKINKTWVKKSVDVVQLSP